MADPPPSEAPADRGLQLALWGAQPGCTLGASALGAL